jgi:PAS domain S-box-containing protein
MKRFFSVFKLGPLQRLNKEIANIIAEMDSTGSIERLKSIVFAESLFQMFIRQDFCLNVILSPEGRFLLVNPYFTEVLGWEQEELKASHFLSFVHPEDVEATRQAWEEFKKKPVVDYPKFKNRYRKKGGGYVVLEWLQMPPSGNGFFFTSSQVMNTK